MKAVATSFVFASLSLCGVVLLAGGSVGYLLMALAVASGLAASIVWLRPAGATAKFLSNIPILPLRFFLVLFLIGMALIAKGTGFVIPGALLIILAYEVLIFGNLWYLVRATRTER